MAMDSTAEDKGDHWLLNGSKTWISNAPVADAVIYYAYTDKAKGGQKGCPPSWSSLKTSTASKPRPGKNGVHFLPHRRDLSQDTRVPKENIIGNRATGPKSCSAPSTRPACRPPPVPWAWPRPAWMTVPKYCNERKQFGKPIGEFQMNQDMIAQMATEIEAARLLVYKAPGPRTRAS
jgi:glutaryl-CoA dehydrogenase (non-decarboxylating)